jgi:hypothetical protein
MGFRKGYYFDQKGGQNVFFPVQKDKIAAKNRNALSIFDIGRKPESQLPCESL